MKLKYTKNSNNNYDCEVIKAKNGVVKTNFNFKKQKIDNLYDNKGIMKKLIVNNYIGIIHSSTLETLEINHTYKLSEDEIKNCPKLNTLIVPHLVPHCFFQVDGPLLNIDTILFKTDEGICTYKLKDGYCFKYVFVDKYVARIYIKNDFEVLRESISLTHEYEKKQNYNELISVDSKMCIDDIIKISDYVYVIIDYLDSFGARRVEFKNISKSLKIGDINSTIEEISFNDCKCPIDISSKKNNSIRKIAFVDDDKVIEIPDNYIFERIRFNFSNCKYIEYSNDYENIKVYLDLNTNNIIKREIEISNVKNRLLSDNKLIVPSEYDVIKFNKLDNLECINSIIIEKSNKNNFILSMPIVNIKKLLLDNDRIDCIYDNPKISIDICQPVSRVCKIDNYIIFSNYVKNIIITDDLNVYRFNDVNFMRNIINDKDFNNHIVNIENVIDKLKFCGLSKNGHSADIISIMKRYNLSYDDIFEIYNVFNNFSHSELSMINNKQLKLDNNIKNFNNN